MNSKDTDYNSAEDYLKGLDNINNDNIAKLVRYYVIMKPGLGLPINDWNVSGVTNMEGLFSDERVCKQFNEDLFKWNVEKVYNMRRMFKGCVLFNKNINNWTVTNVLLMDSMFEGCTQLNKPFDNWKVDKVMNAMSMFEGCTNFEQDLSNWNITKYANEFKSMSYGELCEEMLKGTKIQKNTRFWPKISNRENTERKDGFSLSNTIVRSGGRKKTRQHKKNKIYKTVSRKRTHLIKSKKRVRKQYNK